MCVTDGSGFVGMFVCEELERHGAKQDLVPEHSDYDLVRHADVARMLADGKPDVVIHLAAVVGGIGANMAHPGQYFYDNAMMCLQLIEEAR